MLVTRCCYGPHPLRRLAIPPLAIRRPVSHVRLRDPRSVPAAAGSAPAAVALAEAPVSTEQTGGAGCPRGHQWQVHKFGGTCVSAAERIQRVAQLVVDASAHSQQARRKQYLSCASAAHRSVGTPTCHAVLTRPHWNMSGAHRLLGLKDRLSSQCGYG